MYIRSYAMKAAPQATEALRAVLVELQSCVQELPGSKGVDLLRDLDDPTMLHFVERWETRDAHTAAGKLLPPELMARLKPCLGGSPGIQNLEAIA